MSTSPNRTVSLPLADPPAPRSTPRSRMGWKRCAVLIGLHVVMALHIVQWRMTGRTLSPVEPSEAMETLNSGSLNMGFLMLLAAILLTLIFGRFFCGWGCHVVALQDLCAWLMQKIGVRPKPFRTRLLLFTPVVLAFYMFIWPTVHRVAVVPAVKAMWPSAMHWVGEPVRWRPDGLELDLVVQDFWATFPTIAVAIPFLFVCGFAVVYFLGAKGFCTYGCPYGGFFGPVDSLSVGRIVVDDEKCDGNAHCTAVCTSNVRVHEEIKTHGMVVDPGCMKCMDCISACPTDALSFKFAAPSIVTKPKRAPKRPRFDLSLRSEAVLAAVMFVTFFATRSLYDRVPLLMAIGLAGCTVAMTWTLWKMVATPNARIPWLQLKRKGAVTVAGGVFAAATLVWLALVAHSAWIRGVTLLADLDWRQAQYPNTVLLQPAAPTLEDDVRARALRAISRYERTMPMAWGGAGLLLDATGALRLSYLQRLVGDREGAAQTMDRLIEAIGPRNALVADRAQLAFLLGDQDGGMGLLERVSVAHPAMFEVVELRARALASRGRVDDAVGVCDAALAALDDRWTTAQSRARIMTVRAELSLRTVRDQSALIDVGRRALADVERAVELAPDDAHVRESQAVALMTIAGDPAGAVEAMEAAVSLEPLRLDRWGRLEQLYQTLGRAEDAADARERGERWQRWMEGD